MGRWDFPHPSALPSDPGRGPGPLHARGLLVTDKHRPFRISGGIGFKHQSQWDIAVGTHVHVTLRTQVWNLSKWFYDTSTGATTGAARCGSFVGKGFSLLVVSY
jgi:hypothetical protein